MRTRPRQLIPQISHRRLYSQSTRITSRPRPLFLLGSATVAGGSGAFLLSNVLANQASDVEQEPRLSVLARSYLVYSICSIPSLVEAAPSILPTLLSIPGIKHITEGLVRSTFFAQFVGGESVHDALPIIDAMRERNIGTLLGYSVEVDESMADQRSSTDTHDNHDRQIHKLNIEEMMRSIDEAADYEDRLRAVSPRPDTGSGRCTWVAVKLTALLPSADSLERFSNYLLKTRKSPGVDIPYPGMPLPSDLGVLNHNQAELTREDVMALTELREDLTRLCDRAQERNVRIILDAEHSWFQVCHQFEFVTPRIQTKYSIWTQYIFMDVLHTTTRNPPPAFGIRDFSGVPEKYLRESLHAAKRDGFALGVKLVRGAYHEQELERNKRNANQLPPVWTQKADTDDCYHRCATVIVSSLKQMLGSDELGLAVLFGTHNRESADFVLQSLQESRLCDRDGGDRLVVSRHLADRVAFAQLYGMRDNLTSYLASRIHSPFPMVYKYVPYGKLSDVMPYLSRRASENKSVLGGQGGAKEEKKLAASAIWHRVVSKLQLS